MAKLKTSELRQIAQELGLIENTGTRQKNNGTISFADPVVSTQDCIVSYTIHSNGYIRRKFEYANPTWYRQNQHYQLNRQVKYNGMTARLLATPLEQVAILYLSTINYRKNK
jgi:hypothetical protein